MNFSRDRSPYERPLHSYFTSIGFGERIGGQPLRQAQVAVAGAVTRTDGDGRFFMHAVLPAQATLALQILRQGESHAVEVLSAVERSTASEREDASVSLTITG